MKSLYQVVIRPIISEKADSMREGGGVYTFEVHPDANKIEVRKAVEIIFQVEVTQVRTVIIRGKVKRVGRTAGKKKNWKKAYVTLKQGHSIDLFQTA